MKKFLLNTVAFLFFSCLFYLVALFIWGRFAHSILKSNLDYKIGSTGYLYSRLSEVNNQKDLDVLFLGSSHAYRGFDTRIFSKYGYKTFNLGSSSQTPIQTKVLLNRYLKNLNPKTIVYEVYPASFTVDGVESSLDIIANDKNDFYSLEMALKINNIKTYNTLIYGFIMDLLGLNRSFYEPIRKANETYISGGFVEHELAYAKPQPFLQQRISIKQNQLQSFSEIVATIKRENIDLILVYAPIPKMKYASYDNNGYFDSIMKKYSDYHNFNEIISLNDTLHFYDSHHLNQLGVELFNKKMIEILINTASKTRNIGSTR